MDEETEGLHLRQKLADLEYEHIPDDEAYAIVHRHIHGEVFTLSMDEVKKRLKKYE